MVYTPKGWSPRHFLPAATSDWAKMQQSVSIVHQCYSCGGRVGLMREDGLSQLFLGHDGEMAQIIKTKGGEELVVIPVAEYEALIEAARRVLPPPTRESFFARLRSLWRSGSAPVRRRYEMEIYPGAFPEQRRSALDE